MTTPGIPLVVNGSAWFSCAFCFPRTLRSVGLATAGSTSLVVGARKKTARKNKSGFFAREIFLLAVAAAALFPTNI